MSSRFTLVSLRKARFFNRVHVASTGENALDYIFCRGKYAGRKSAQRPQMILLDLQLPKMNGLEVLRFIKADKETRTIPVIILTASQNSRDVAECKRLGAENYIIKPLNFQNLIKATPDLNLNWALIKPAGKNSANIPG